MAKRLQKKPLPYFQIGMVLYALVFLTAAGVGLRQFWGYLDAYERSRPATAIDQYLAQLTPEHICREAEGLLEKVDLRAQSKETCLQIMAEAVTGPLTYAKNLSRSTDEKLVYALRKDGTTIGFFYLEPSGEEERGFTPWTVTGEEFDLSCLLTAGVEITVPRGYTVRVNGIPLGESCVAQAGIPFPELAGFDEDYDLPTLTRYQAGPFLGPVQVTVTDPAGEEISPEADRLDFLDNCSQEEKAVLEEAAAAFVGAYVDFTSCKNGDTLGNLRILTRMMVPNGELAGRMKAALDGLYWVSDRHASVAGLEVSLCTRLEEGLYLCEAAYTVDTTDHTGKVQVQNRVKIIFRTWDGGLLAEAMVSS